MYSAVRREKRHLMTLREIWNNMSYRFCLWLIAALLAYRTGPDTGNAMAVSVLTGVIYLVMWVLVIELDSRKGKALTGLTGFMAVLMGLMVFTYVTAQQGEVYTTAALLWMVPVGVPLQGIVRVFNDAASRADAPMAMISLCVMAVLLAVRLVLGFVRKRK